MPKRAIFPLPSHKTVINIVTGKPMCKDAIPAVCRSIRFYREKAKLEQAELAKAIGVTANAISNWENGRSRPDINLLPAICATLHISFYELFAISDPYVKFTDNEVHMVGQYRQLKPVYQKAINSSINAFLDAQEMEDYRELIELIEYDHSVAAGVSFSTEYDDPGTPVFAYREDIDPKADCVFTVNGDSMEPTYHNGDQVLVERLYNASDIHIGDIGVFADGNDLWIKEYRPDGLYSHNKEYAPMVFG